MKLVWMGLMVILSLASVGFFLVSASAYADAQFRGVGSNQYPDAMGAALVGLLLGVAFVTASVFCFIKLRKLN